MCNPQFVSQSSCDLDIYLPSELDFEETLPFQSPHMLIHSINFDIPSSVHRMELDLFDPINDDMEASSALTNEIPSAYNGNFDGNDLANYFCGPSSVVPHVPNLSSESITNDIFLVPSSPSHMSSQNSSLKPNSPDMKKFFIFDEATGRARRPLLYEFIRTILDHDEYSYMAEYTDRKNGIFKLHNPQDVAELWKHVKGRNSNNEMTYEKLARAIRHYYKTGIMHSSRGRFTFQFGPKSGFGTTLWPAY